MPRLQLSLGGCLLRLHTCLSSSVYIAQLWPPDRQCLATNLGRVYVVHEETQIVLGRASSIKPRLASTHPLRDRIVDFLPGSFLVCPYTLPICSKCRASRAAGVRGVHSETLAPLTALHKLNSWYTRSDWCLIEKPCVW